MQAKPPFGRFFLLVLPHSAHRAGAGCRVYLYAGPGPPEARTVIIPYGAHIYDIADRLDTAGVTIKLRSSSALPPNCSRMTRSRPANTKSRRMKASPASSTKDASAGQSVVRLFTVAEGLTSAEITDLLADVSLSGLVAAPPPEGTLLPESYRYIWGDGVARGLSIGYAESDERHARGRLGAA